MNEPYAPAPGQSYPPGSPPPRQGMGCFAKGCFVTVLVLVAIGILTGVAGWYLYSSVHPFVSSEPVAIRTFPGTDAQYQGILNRIQVFQTGLANTHTATLELTADDLNILIARAATSSKARIKMYLSMADNQMEIECCFPLSGQGRRGTSTGKVFYFSGKLFCDLSFADGEFAIVGRKLETLDGQPAAAFLTAIIASSEFNRSASRSFNEGFRNSLRQNPSGEEFLTKVRTITVRNNHLVLTAVDR